MDNDKNLDNALKYIHEKVFNQLLDIDRVCRKHNIKYSLHGGTLLGAIRHGGFIPWDDDADIVMERKDNSKFIEIYNAEKNSDYDIRYDGLWICRVIEKPDVKFPNIKLDNIYTDIFVYDKVPKNKVVFRLQIVILKLLQGMMKEKVDYENKSFFINILQFFSHLFGLPFSYKKKLDWYNKASGIGNKSDSEYLFISNDQYKCLGKYISKEAFETVEDIEFNKAPLLIMRGWEESLIVSYGNSYMTPPPVEMRKPVHIGVR